MLSDTTFKYLFKNNEYRKFFNYLIKSVTDIDISDFKLYDAELNSGEDIKHKYVVQINFNKKKHPFIGKASYVIMDELTKKEIKDFKIYDIYLENYKDIIYNGDNKEEMYLSLFTASSYEELRRIAKDEKEALKVLDELERLAINDELGAVYDNEIMQKKMISFAHNDGVEEGLKEGLKQGRKEAEITIAKNLLKDDLPIEMVSKNTGLSIEELKKLQ